MKPVAKPSTTISAALAWDGARVSARSLPSAAKKFLAVAPSTSTQKAAKLFAAGNVREIRICWVPRLQGGDQTLSAPFAALNGKRLAFRAAKTRRYGEILAVVYRRLSK